MQTVHVYKYKGEKTEQETVAVPHTNTAVFSTDPREESDLHIYPQYNIAFHEYKTHILRDSFRDAYSLGTFVPQRSDVFGFARAADEIKSIAVLSPSGTVQREGTIEDVPTSWPPDTIQLTVDGVKVQYNVGNQLQIEDGVDCEPVFDLFGEILGED